MSDTPGRLLTAAREACALSREDVAKQTRLSVSAIADIESDHYERFGAATFVRGYLRSYARVVGVSEEKILSVWEATGREAKLTPPAPTVIEGISKGPQASCQSEVCTDTPSRSVMVIGALVVLGAVAWWFNQRPTAPVVNTAQLAPKTTEAIAAAPAPVQLAENEVKPAPEKTTAAVEEKPVVKHSNHKATFHHHHKDAKPLHVTYTVKPVSANELASDH